MYCSIVLIFLKTHVLLCSVMCMYMKYKVQEEAVVVIELMLSKHTAV